MESLRDAPQEEVPAYGLDAAEDDGRVGPPLGRFQAPAPGVPIGWYQAPAMDVPLGEIEALVEPDDGRMLRAMKKLMEAGFTLVVLSASAILAGPPEELASLDLFSKTYYFMFLAFVALGSGLLAMAFALRDVPGHADAARAAELAAALLTGIAMAVVAFWVVVGF